MNGRSAARDGAVMGLRSLLLLLSCVLPFGRLIDGRQAAAGNLAVVMPFTSSNVHKIQRNFDFWVANPPCHLLRQRRQRVRTTFVFQNNLVIDGRLRLVLQAMWANTTGAEKCFDNVLYLSANQTAEQEQGQTVGGCYQHYNSFESLHALGFDHWLQMEPDVIPVRPDWLTRITEEVGVNTGCSHWWILGTPPSYEPHRVTHSQRTDGTTFNGNAMYCLNAEVLQFVKDIQAQYPPVGCHVPRQHERDGLRGLVGFDWVNYLFRTSPHNRERFKGRAFLFRAVEWINDWGCCCSQSDVKAAIEANPGLMLVHTKVFF
jgi:hypothetical protein